jgi:hypothetical protein
MLACTTGPSAAAITYTDLVAGLTPVYQGSVQWGDYDNDGDLDVLLVGEAAGSPATRIYRNNGNGTFTDIAAALPNLKFYCAAIWGDYDNDGDLDILMAGATSDISYTTRIYRNDGGGSFTNIGAPLQAVASAALAWADYDNDGDLDALVAGYTLGSQRITRLYRNDHGSFVEIDPGLPGIRFGSVAWGDYDADGDLDLVIAGETSTGSITRLYVNASGSLSWRSTVSLPGIELGTVAWGDCDNDGDLDLLIVGATETYPNYNPIGRVYRNENSNHTFPSFLTLPALYGSSGCWGDYDNDGDSDLLLTGYTGSSAVTRIYGNNGGTGFTDSGIALEGINQGNAAWGDYDGDGDLDIVLAGVNGAGARVARIHRSDGAPGNPPPSAPSLYSASSLSETVGFWCGSTFDTPTPSAALSFNLRIGTTPGGSQIMSPMAGSADGRRRLPQLGNAQHGSPWWIRNLPAGIYYWSVQAIDGAYVGSPFGPTKVMANIFRDAGSAFPNMQESAADWGDYDNDGDLDLLICGETTGGCVTYVCRNDGGGVFGSILAPEIWAARNGSVEWGDYDNDGDLDILLTGDSCAGTVITHIYRNDGGGVFRKVETALPGISDGAATWGDCDNDGDLDILMAGCTLGGGRYAAIFRNDGPAGFANLGAGLAAVCGGSAAWGDYDNDGDLDVLLTGTAAGGALTRIYRNNGSGEFPEAVTSLPGASGGTGSWADVDNDGDLDVLLVGINGSDPIGHIYRNNGNGTFSQLQAGLPGIMGASADWGDYDNDGDLDLMLTGMTNEPAPRLFRNDGAGTFTGIDIALPTLLSGVAKWGDYDKDGDLDLLLSGLDGMFAPYTRLFRTEGVPANTAPGVPTGLSAEVAGDQVTLSWNSVIDGQTPTAGLSYNVRVGTTSTGSEVKSPMASPTSGYRRIVRTGNAGQRTYYTLKLLRQAVHYWTVQAVDAAYAGSAFAPPEIFVSTTDVADEVPRELSFALAGANPTTGAVSFEFGLPVRSHVRLAIYDIAGRRVATPLDEERTAGSHSLAWDGRDTGAAPGVYFARLDAGGREFTRRFVVLR